jgi:lipoyl(octanoyl) transferase
MFTKMNKELFYCDLGFIDYKQAWDLQRATFELRVKNQIPDVLFLLEHPNTYTLGKTADHNNLIGSEEYLLSNEISVYDIDRGGDITYHGPGQIVGYPIISLNDWKKDTHKYLRALEETIIQTCLEYGITGSREPKYTGVWVEDRKIAAIGIKVSRWITMHGFAFNVNTDLSFFSGIIPCGISDKDVTSIKREIKNEVDIDEVKSKLTNNFAKIFEYKNVSQVTREEIFSVNLTTVK